MEQVYWQPCCRISVKKEKKVVILDNLSTGRIDNIKNFKSKIKFVKCDISKKGKWINEFKGKIYIIHLASVADIVPSIQYRKNILILT